MVSKVAQGLASIRDTVVAMVDDLATPRALAIA